MKNKQLRIIMVVVFALILAVTGLTTKTMLDSTKQFSQDGYVLVPSRDTEVTTNVNEQYYFSAGTNYRKQYGQTIKFKDTSNKEVSMGTEEFVHYNDGSLGAFTKGVVMDLAEIGDNQVTYYGVSEKTTILKQGQDYTMSYLGNSLTLNEFIWKIADDTYMLVSPQIVLHLTDDVEVVLEDYIQVQYVAGGIARLIHQRGTYQTVSDDAYISTDSGFELKLTERAFYNGLEKAVSLDEMVIDSSTNLLVDENEEELKIPTFRVVNGKDGADGADGFTGEDGLDGESGDSGNSGENGEKGQNGFDGLEGDSGEWGYDGQTGEAGEDAGHAEESDGIVGILQDPAPTVTMDTSSYQVGPNSVEMKLNVSDPSGMLVADEDIDCTIYKRDDMTPVFTAPIKAGDNGLQFKVDTLEPGTDYVLIVTGSYESDYGRFSEVNFFTKVFQTEALGISIEKVQVTEDTITVKTVISDPDKISSYQIGLFKEDDTSNITTYAGNTFTQGETLVFDNAHVITGAAIEPNTEYTVQLFTIADSEGALIKSDVSKTVKTLKTKPYYLSEDGTAKIDVSQKTTKILTSSRYQTASISLDTAIIDEQNGIKGYRYELYETSTNATDITTPVQVKEVQTMETVTFNIEAEQNYFARVVVMFDDNEKVVELIANPSDIVSLARGNYPTVSFVGLKHEYDMVSGYIMVEDNSENQDMLLGHINSDFPLVLTLTADVGEVQRIELYDKEEQTPSEGSVDSGTSVAYYPFKVDGLGREKTYTISVSGYVNDTDMTWDELKTSDGKAGQLKTFQYLSGYNVNLGAPTAIVLSMRSVANVGDDLFTVALSFTSPDGEDASYEVGNMEKISFTLRNKATGQTIGTTANLMDANGEEHASDYSTYYSPAGTLEENRVYSATEGQPYSTYILTDESFGAKGDLRIANGGDFEIVVDSAYDYTQDDTEYPDITNKLDISGSLEFHVEESHTRVADPNDAITVTPITNINAATPVASLEDDTIVGLKVDSGYSLKDVYQIVYYVYELTSATGEPLVEDDDSTDVLNKTRDSAYWKTAPYKTKTVTVGTQTEGGAVQPWVVYFNDKDETSSTANLSDAVNGTRTTLFERGKVYYIRYEIVTDGSMEDTNEDTETKIYPNCVYSGIGEDEIPFYRSNVFGLERQVPTVQRYLWDTSTSDGLTIQTWKYLIDDPDNAILAYANNVKTDAKATIKQYTTFDEAFVAAEGTGTETVSASLTALYDENSVLKTTYETVAVSALEDTKWYTVSIPYCLFEQATRTEYESVNQLSIVSIPNEVKAVSHIMTSNVLDGITDVNGATDYVVNGVMVKDTGADWGISDEYGYRIRLKLQGLQVDRVAALKVTLQGTDDSGTAKSVVYDPVAIEMQSGKQGAGSNYAFAYLEYAPIVKAGLNLRDTTISVEAYYTTYRDGMYSYAEEYTDVAHTVGYTSNDNLFANTNAWALKQYSYQETEGITSYTYAYQMIDDKGALQPVSAIYKDDANPDILTYPLAGSISIPQVSADGAAENLGFADGKTMAFRYALNPLVYSQDATGTFADTLLSKNLSVEMDAIGAKSMDGNYYVMEQLSKATLKIDFGDSATNYETATFTTGDGMPGIAYSTAGSSTGMSSATVQFDIKGTLPGTDQGYYIYLYPQGSDEKIELEKWQEDGNGKVYYLVKGALPTTDSDVKLSTADDATDYGLPADADSEGSKVTFAIRGLDRNTNYQVKLMARNTKTTDNMQYLFDYQRGSGALPYTFTTKNMIDLVSGDINFVYDSYDGKYGLMNYAVLGSEGTGMRIFYRVYKDYGTAFQTEINFAGKTLTDYGYMLEPLGNTVKYYQSDMSLCNPVNVDFSPDGPLEMGTTYTVEYKAYTSTNAGAILDATEPIGHCTKEFTTPASLTGPRCSVRVVSGMTDLTVTVVMSDAQKTIVDDVFYIDVYDLEGVKITTEATRLKVNTKSGSASTVYSGKLENLPENTAFKVVVTADVDSNNDGVADTTYKNELATSTISTATATVATSYTAEGYVNFKLLDLANFDNIDKIVYSIDSQDGGKNYENVSKALTDWTQSGNTYSYTTGFAPEEAGTYHYTIQFYEGTALRGSSSGYFTK